MCIHACDLLDLHVFLREILQKRFPCFNTQPHLNTWGVGRFLELEVMQTGDCVLGIHNCLQ